MEIRNIVNLTPHELVIKTTDATLSIPASGTVARCAQKTEITDEVVYDVLLQDPDTKETKAATMRIPITKVTLGDVENLPDPKDGTIYAVSRVVAEAIKGKRNDIVIPGPAIRDDKGRIIGADGFSII